MEKDGAVGLGLAVTRQKQLTNIKLKLIWDIWDFKARYYC